MGFGKKIYTVVYRLCFNLTECRYFVLDYLSEKLYTPVNYSMFAYSFWAEMLENEDFREKVVEAVSRRIKRKLDNGQAS